MGTLLPEMSAHEKTLDHFIEMLRKDQVGKNKIFINHERLKDNPINSFDF